MRESETIRKVRDDIVKEGYRWLDTPWQHHQRTIGLGVDCVQLLAAVADEVGINYGVVDNYYSSPKDEQLLYTFREHFLEEEMYEPFKPGYLLVFQYLGVPHHVGIATGNKNMIHASLSRGKVCLECHNYNYWMRRLVGVFDPLSTPDGEINYK